MFGGDILKKFIQSSDILKLIKDGDTLLVGGFGLSGTPLTLIDEIASSSLKNLTVVSNNLGEPGKGLGKLLLSGCLKKRLDRILQQTGMQ